MKNIKDFNSFVNENNINEGYNLFTLQARVEHMDDLYVTVDGKGDEVFKVNSVEIEPPGDNVEAGTLGIVSEETGEEMIIDHDAIVHTLVGDQYKGHNKKESGMRHD